PVNETALTLRSSQTPDITTAMLLLPLVGAISPQTSEPRNVTLPRAMNVAAWLAPPLSQVTEVTVLVPAAVPLPIRNATARLEPLPMVIPWVAPVIVTLLTLLVRTSPVVVVNVASNATAMGLAYGSNKICQC